METFIKIQTNLFSTIKLLPIERHFIAYIISFQVSNKKLYEKNPSIAKNIGTSIHTLKKMITKLNNDYSTFFIHNFDKDEHTFFIDIDKLNKFLNEPIEKVSKKPTSTKNENKVVLSNEKEKEVDEPTSTENVAEIVVKQSQIANVTLIKDFNFDLPPIVDIKVIFEDGDEIKTKAYLFQGKYFYVNDFDKQRSWYNQRQLERK